MSAELYDSIANYVSLYAPCALLLFGNIGTLFNLLTFTSKKLRSNPCGWYFLMSSINDFFLLNYGLISKLLSDYFGIDYENKVRAYCKFRIYILWVLPCISTSYLVLASLDRCLSTSSQTHLRSFSQIKVAHRLTIIPIILYCLTSSHQLFYFDLRPTCLAQPGGYSIFLSLYSILWTSLIPQSVLLICGLITYKHIHSSRKRLVRENTRPATTNRTDLNLIRMTLVQVLASSILLNVRTIYYSYYVLSSNISKGPKQIAFEYLLLQISSFVFYINFAASFYLNTLMSILFRQVLFKRLNFYFTTISPHKFRIHPLVEHQQQTQLHQINNKQT